MENYWEETQGIRRVEETPDQISRITREQGWEVLVN